MEKLIILPEQNDSDANKKRSSNPPRRRRRPDGSLSGPPLQTRKEEARKRAGWTDDLDQTPRPSISHILKGIGVDACIEALLCDDSPEALAFNAKYSSISRSDREYLAIDEIALLAGLSSRVLIQTITGALFQQTAETSKAIALSAQPDIVKKTVEMAKTDRGEKDREMYHRAMGFLPTPKGAQTTINLQQLNQGGESAQRALGAGGDASRDPAAPLVLGSMDDVLLDLQTVIRPQLPTSSAAAVVEAEPMNTTVPANVADLDLDYIEADV